MNLNLNPILIEGNVDGILPAFKELIKEGHSIRDIVKTAHDEFDQEGYTFLDFYDILVLSGIIKENEKFGKSENDSQDSDEERYEEEEEDEEECYEEEDEDEEEEEDEDEEEPEAFSDMLESDGKPKDMIDVSFMTYQDVMSDHAAEFDGQPSSKMRHSICYERPERVYFETTWPDSPCPYKLTVRRIFSSTDPEEEWQASMEFDGRLFKTSGDCIGNIIKDYNETLNALMN